MAEPISPAVVYAARLAARRAEADALRTRLGRLSLLRLAAFLVGLVVAVLGYATDAFSPAWALVPAVAFFGLVVRFELTRGGLARAERAARFYAGGLLRLDGKPSGGDDGSRYADDAHPYAADLDLFGPGSVFERLNACRTRAGEDTLAGWLRAPAGPEEVAARQAAVRDFSPRLDLREGLAVAGADVPGAVDYAKLADWGRRPAEPVAAWKGSAVEALGWANVFAWIGWLAVGTGVVPVLAFGLLSAAVAVPLLGWSRRVLTPIERAERDLALLETVLARFEREAVAAPRLRDLQAAMRADGLSAAAQLRDLGRLVGWFNARRNAMFIPIAVLRLWDVRFAFKLERWRARSGPRVADWLRAVGEAEALGSLAGFAYENPADVFPDVIEGKTPPPGPLPPTARGTKEEPHPLTPSPAGGGGTGNQAAGLVPPPPAGEGVRGWGLPVFDAVGLGHPLLSATACVRNDVTLDGDGPRVLLVSGSNMSGKSTLLRAVGVNVVLALAGGVVRAGRLTLTPFAVGATMRVQDSLQAGRSRFFAEVRKVRDLLDVATVNDPPLLFLLDELFAGTNSADRVAGAEGVVRALLDAGAVGLLTTHDLSVTEVAGRLGGRAANVHFRDGLAGGELSFDYLMRPGVVPHGNGLALMRAVGLRV
ncbi:MAG: hypothetical protein K2X82_22250 [Gemmataceae bacterium]|nr:hypothetical protein [Gemmataceae bacterium]